MRNDQNMGLSTEAKAFLGHQVPVEQCPTCGHQVSPPRAVIGHYPGACGEDHPLYRYVLKEGHADEFLQVTEWGREAMFFLGLRVFKADGSLEGIIEWTRADVDEAFW